MSYRDPYGEQYGRNNQAYADGPRYNPYEAQQVPHQTYDQGGYEPQYHEAGYRDEPEMMDMPQSPERPNFAPTAGGDGFVVGGEKSVRSYQHANQGRWTKGGRGRCIGRFCCCTLLITLFLIISIVLALLLWVRPPNITVGTVNIPTSGGDVQVQTDGITISLGVNISVENPNYFAVTFKDITAQILYPLNNNQTNVGGGSETDITFHSHSLTNFTFPFAIDYKLADDPNKAILVDIASKCGFIGDSKSQITVDYKLTLGLRILFITVSPVVSNSMSFDCPLTEADIKSLGGDVLGNL